MDGDWWCVDDDVTIRVVSAMGKSEGVRVRKGGREEGGERKDAGAKERREGGREGGRRRAKRCWGEKEKGGWEGKKEGERETILPYPSKVGGA